MAHRRTSTGKTTKPFSTPSLQRKKFHAYLSCAGKTSISKNALQTRNKVRPCYKVEPCCARYMDPFHQGRSCAKDCDSFAVFSRFLIRRNQSERKANTRRHSQNLIPKSSSIREYFR